MTDATVACYVGTLSIVQMFQEKCKNGQFEKGHNIFSSTFSLHVWEVASFSHFTPLIEYCSHSF